MPTEQEVRPLKGSIDLDAPVAVDRTVDRTSDMKRRPWRAVFPNPNPDPSQARKYGFKKGEVINIAGNAGNFFAHDKWQIESQSSAAESK
jgi:hypothetical protein